jgi:hypothetical protein
MAAQTTDDAVADQHRGTLKNALDLWTQSQQEQAAEALKPAVEAGWLPAVLAAAWFNQQRGLHAESVPLVQRALDAGNALPGMWFFGNYIATAEHRPLALEIARVANESGYPWDVVGNWSAFWTQGDQDGAVALFEVTTRPQPAGLRAEWERMLDDVRTGMTEVQGAATVVSTARDEAVEAIRGHESAIREEMERVEQLVGDTTSLVHGATADHIAKAYAERASNALSAARKWTGWAIVVGVVAAVWAVAVTVHAFAESQGVSTTIGKVLVSIPILVVAGYLASIASNNRRMGWHWSHVELQIRTAEPFIANLDQDTRNRLLAALAIRFFPGQGQDPQQGAAASTERLDVGTLISGILHELGPRPSRAAAPAAPSSPDTE